jgi:hypothetical protein
MMSERKNSTDNVLVRLIDSGRIKNFDGLKNAYRRLVLKTHPDAIGSDRHLERYLELSNHYDIAKEYLKRHIVFTIDERDSTNHRLVFFQQLNLIETLEMPYSFHPEENADRLSAAKRRAVTAFSDWRNDHLELYKRADGEYTRMKKEKPSGPYLKNALALNIRPLIHNLIAYHLTGRELYVKQARQNLSGILHRLSEKGYTSLRDFLSFLLEDLKNGAALLD